MSTQVNDATSHASRNPGKDVQDARSRKKAEPLSDAQKATRALTRVAKKLLQEEFEQDLDAFYAYRGKTVIELAAKYSREPDYIKALLINSSQFKQTRTISVRNAVIHDIAVQAKAGEFFFVHPTAVTRLTPAI